MSHNAVLSSLRSGLQYCVPANLLRSEERAATRRGRTARTRAGCQTVLTRAAERIPALRMHRAQQQAGAATLRVVHQQRASQQPPRALCLSRSVCPLVATVEYTESYSCRSLYKSAVMSCTSAPIPAFLRDRQREQPRCASKRLPAQHHQRCSQRSPRVPQRVGMHRVG